MQHKMLTLYDVEVIRHDFQTAAISDFLFLHDVRKSPIEPYSSGRQKFPLTSFDLFHFDEFLVFELALSQFTPAMQRLKQNKNEIYRFIVLAFVLALVFISLRFTRNARVLCLCSCLRFLA